MTSGLKWGEQAEADAARKRREAVQELPEHLRARGEAILAECEGDFKAWSFTIALMVLTRAAKRPGEELAEQTFELLRETLLFYRIATIAQDTEFWWNQLKELRRDGQERLLPQMLAGAHRSALEQMDKATRRLRLLDEAQETSEETSEETSKETSNVR